MKKTLLTLLFGSLAWSAQSQNVYTENFDGCALPAGWTNTAVTGPNAWLFSAASSFDGGSIDGSCFATINDDGLGSGAPALIADLITPVIDLSGYSNAEFRFDYIFEDYFGSSLSVSFWNGTSWNVVWTENTDPGCFGFYPDCNPRQGAISLAGYLNADFRAKFTYNDNASWSWYVGIDNVAIYLPPTDDAVLTSIVAPTTGCGLSNGETVSLDVYNNGQNAITSFTGGYAIDGGNWVTETFTVSIAPGASSIVSFAALADLSNTATYSIDTYIAMVGDLDLTNDSASSSVTNIPVLGATLPYLQDFESGAGGWITNGVNNTWALGQPAGTFINAAFSGVNAWVTNLSGNHNNEEQSYIESPCMDFSSLIVPPVLRFKQIFNSESCCDGLWVEMSTNAGTTWTRLGEFGDPNNWYNNEFNDWWSGSSGTAGVWRTATHLLNGAQGQSSVKIRFVFNADFSLVNEGFGLDDIEIFEQPSINAGITQILSPATGCGLGQAEALTVVIENFGAADLTGFDVVYDAGNGPVVEQYAATLVGGDVDTFTFATLLDLSVPATYSIQVWTDVANDGDAANDSLAVSITNSPVVAALPYFEDFETNDGGWYPAIQSGTANSWQWGQPAGTFISAANSGINAWVTNLTGEYVNNENSYLVSPCFDFSALTLDPILSFAHIYNTESCCDEGWVDVSFDAGATWQKVGAFGEGENWYNYEFGDYWNGDSGQPGAWRNASHLIDGAAGQSSVRIRFFFSTDISVVYNGFGVDDVRIEEQPAINGATLAITSPVSGCGQSAAEAVSVTVANVGSEVIDPVSISYQVNGGTVVTEVFTATLNTFDTLSFTFGQPLNLSVAGDYTVAVWVNVAGDGDTSNDTLSVLVQSIPTVTSIPYTQDFENGTGGWSSTGTNGTWELGQPQGTLINSAFSGVNAWATNLNTLTYADNQTSYLTSPCFDFSSLTDDPIIEFALIHNSETNWDGTVLEVSTDGGTTWSVLGNSGEGINWYTNQFDNWWDGNSGGNTTWVIAEHILNGVAGESAVQLRFKFTSDGIFGFEGAAVDNINIYPQPQFDLAAVALENPEDGCSLGTQPVSFTLWNKGLQTISNFPVGFSVNGGPTQTETVTATLQQGDSITYTFSIQYANLVQGTNTIDVFTLLPNDEVPANNAVLGNVVISYGSTPLNQTATTTSLISTTLPEGTSSSIYFCGMPSGLNGGCFTIGSVTIGSISHSYVSDLSIYLISPAGDTLLLSQNNGGSGQNISNVVFNGTSSNDIANQFNGIAPGTYAPQGVGGFYNFYDGQNPNGAWTLYVADNFFGDDGVLNSWSMEFLDFSPEVSLPYSDTTICHYGSLDLTVPGSYTSYLWSTGQNTQTATLFGNVLGEGTHEISVLVDYLGCSAQSNSITVTVETCAGIEELGNLNIEMYPNPTDGMLTLDVQGDAEKLTVKVLDMSGKTLFTQGFGAVVGGMRATVDLNHVAAGVYMVRFSNGEAMRHSKLIKR